MKKIINIISASFVILYRETGEAAIITLNFSSPSSEARFNKMKM